MSNNDHISRLHRWLDARRVTETPKYSFGEVSGEPHCLIFRRCTVEVLGRRFVAIGEFKQQREAKQAAARVACEQLQGEEEPLPPFSPPSPPSTPPSAEDEVEEVIHYQHQPTVLPPASAVCYLIDLDNIKVTPADIQRMAKRGDEIHLFYSPSRDDKDLMQYGVKVHLHKAPALVPEMADHCLSWWVCREGSRLRSMNTKVYIVSKDKGMGAVAILARLELVEVEHKCSLS